MCGLTELLQGVHGVLHVDPEAELSQRDLVVGHSEGQLSGGAVDDLTEGQHGQNLPARAKPATGPHLASCLGRTTAHPGLHPTHGTLHLFL